MTNTPPTIPTPLPNDLTLIDFNRVAIVTGGRDWIDHRKLDSVLDQFDPNVVIHGGASGADAIARQWAQRYAIEICVPYLGRFDKRGGPVRNRVLAELGRQFDVVADVRVFAFITERSRGTWSMIHEAERNGLMVVQTFADR